MNNKTGELIEKYRKEKGLTQSELAKKLGVSNTAISKWEHGNNLPDITLLEPLSEILGIDKLLLFTSEHEAKEITSERTKSIRKINIIKSLITISLFLLSILFTNYVSYKVYSHKLNKIEQSKPEIYRFYSKDEEYFINGYIIFKNNESTVIFDQLSYQNIALTKSKSQKEEKITSAELFFNINGETILRNTYIPQNDSEDKNEIFLNLSKLNNQKVVSIDKNNLLSSEVIIALDKQGKISKSIIKIKIRKGI